MSKDSKIVKVISIVIVVAALVLLGMFIRNALSGNKSEVKSPQTSNNIDESVGGTVGNPVKLLDSDMSLTGSEFAEKYNGKYISFHGLLQGTSTIKGASNAHTVLLYGDDLNKGALADSSPFWITAGTSTFSDDLQEFAKDNSSPYETGNYPKVHVIAKVHKFNESNSAVQLDPAINVDGKKPSVTSR